MRIDGQSMGYFDILWFARDTIGNIVCANSLESQIPEFVCCDAEKAERLATLLCGQRAIDRNRNPQIDTEKLTSLNGFFCYRADNPYTEEYRLIATPKTPARFSDMPPPIQELLEDNLLPFIAGETLSFTAEDTATHSEQDAFT